MEESAQTCEDHFRASRRAPLDHRAAESSPKASVHLLFNPARKEDRRPPRPPPEHRGQAGVPPRMSLRSLSLLCVAASAAAQGSSSRLRVEYLDAPLTIDVATPRFSFAPLHPTRGAALASYRIVVAQVFPSAAPIWDSGVVAATSSLNIGESAAQPARVRTRECSGGSSFLSFSLSSHPSSFCCAFFSDRAQATRARRCRRTRTSRGR